MSVKLSLFDISDGENKATNTLVSAHGKLNMGICISNFPPVRLLTWVGERFLKNTRETGRLLLPQISLVGDTSENMSLVAQQRKEWKLNPGKRHNAFKAALKQVTNQGGFKPKPMDDLPKCLSSSNDKF